MRNKLLNAIEKPQIRTDLVKFKSGDEVEVHVKIQEGKKTRIQIFAGLVIRKRGQGMTQTFTVRKISSGIGVERIFPTNSPNIAKIVVKHSNKVARAKLYYMRQRKGKLAKLKKLKKTRKSSVVQ